MIHAKANISEFSGGLPRMRGDDPFGVDKDHASLAFAPHARGMILHDPGLSHPSRRLLCTRDNPFAVAFTFVTMFTSRARMIQTVP